MLPNAEYKFILNFNSISDYLDNEYKDIENCIRYNIHLVLDNMFIIPNSVMNIKNDTENKHLKDRIYQLFREQEYFDKLIMHSYIGQPVKYLDIKIDNIDILIDIRF